jgi:hypothetical protein
MALCDASDERRRQALLVAGLSCLGRGRGPGNLQGGLEARSHLGDLYHQYIPVDSTCQPPLAS